MVLNNLRAPPIWMVTDCGLLRLYFQKHPMDALSIAGSPFFSNERFQKGLSASKMAAA